MTVRARSVSAMLNFDRNQVEIRVYIRISAEIRSSALSFQSCFETESYLLSREINKPPR